MPKATQRIVITVSVDDYERWATLAKNSGYTMSGLIRLAMEHEIAQWTPKA